MARMASKPLIAILDTGLPKNYTNLGCTILSARPFSPLSPLSYFDTDGHGTKVISAIAGINEPEFQLPGLVENANIIVAKTHDGGSTRPSNETLLDALQWALQFGADLVNISGSLGRHRDHRHPLIEKIDILMASFPNSTLVGSAGNHHGSILGIGMPAAATNAVAVTAWDRKSGHNPEYPFSDAVKAVTVSGPYSIPAYDISTDPNYELRGTSAATAFITAYIYNNSVSFSPGTVKELLENKATRPVGFETFRGGVGVVT